MASWAEAKEHVIMGGKARRTDWWEPATYVESASYTPAGGKRMGYFKLHGAEHPPPYSDVRDRFLLTDEDEEANDWELFW